MDLSSYKYRLRDFRFMITRSQCYRLSEKLRTYKEGRLTDNDIRVMWILVSIERMN